MSLNSGLIFKWLKSCNTSSKESRILGEKTQQAFGLTSKQYRKLLSYGRKKTKVLERIMSTNEWEKIDFSKLPSRAGMIYRNAFARRDIIKEKYAAFAKSKETKVNANVLYPHDIAHRALQFMYDYNHNSIVDRAMLQKYWDNLPNYYGDREENGIAVVDVSGSMSGIPMEAAISMGAYIAEKAHGPFAHHFITFSDSPQLVEFEGTDIVDKMIRCEHADWGGSTNIEATFDLLLDTARKEHVKAEDVPSRVYIFSDMEFNCYVTTNCSSFYYDYYSDPATGEAAINTLFEAMKEKWASYGYKMPDCVFWNLNARHNNIPAMGEGFSYVSGFSPIMIEQILAGKTGVDLMLEKLNSKRYEAVR